MCRWIVSVVFMASATSALSADQHLFEELRLAVSAQRSQMPQGRRDQLSKEAVRVVDCSVYEPISDPDRRIRPTHAQYIFNANYSWGEIDAGRGRCIVLDSPIARPLSRNEALDALTAARIPFPVPFYEQTPVPAVPPHLGVSTHCDPMPQVHLDSGEVTTAPCPLR